MRIVFFALLAFLGLNLAGCGTVSPQEQHFADQSQCANYGYKPGTNQFANCMMKLDTRRQDQAVSQEQDDEIMKARSIRRNGNPKYPVCKASMSDVKLDIENNAWYGPNCREQ